MKKFTFILSQKCEIWENTEVIVNAESEDEAIALMKEQGIYILENGCTEDDNDNIIIKDSKYDFGTANVLSPEENNDQPTQLVAIKEGYAEVCIDVNVEDENLRDMYIQK